MSTIPKRNLGPTSEPWGRWVEQELAKGERNLRNSADNSNNAYKAVNATVRKLQTTVATLQDQQAQLETQQGKLEQQSNMLVSTIRGLPNHQIRNAYADLSVINTSWRQVWSQSIKVPSTHNYVWWVISSSGLFQADRYDGGTLNFRTELLVNGSSLGYFTDNYNMSDNPYFNANNTVQHGATVAAGATVTVRIYIYKAISATGFYNKSLRASFSAVSYTR